jgi:arylsulfatase A-like enzyme
VGRAVLALLVALPVLACREPPSTRPNFLLVVMDTARRANLGCYGHSRATTPLIDRFAESAVVYDEAYAVGPWTVPNHASMFTGLYPAAHRATQETEVLAAGSVTLAEILRKDGYDTTAFVTNAALPRQRGFDQGFDEYVELWRAEVRESVLRGEVPPPGDAGAAVAGLAIREWLATRDDPERPFFLFVNYIEPHMPYRPPPRYRRAFLGPGRRVSGRAMRYDYAAFLSGRYSMSSADFEAAEALYDGEIRHLDDEIGALLAWMERESLLDDTWVILTSDHGEAFGEHGLVGHQFALYDVVLRVPLIVREPRGVRPGRSDRRVQLVDLFPTILDAAGSAAPVGVPAQGESLLAPGRRTEILAEYYRPVRTLQEIASRYPAFDASFLDRRIRSLASGGWKLIWSSDGRHELYDLSGDPGELDNRIEVEPDRADAMLRRLAGRLAEIRNGAPEVHAPPPEPEDAELRRELRALGYLD